MHSNHGKPQYTQKFGKALNEDRLNSKIQLHIS